MIHTQIYIYIYCGSMGNDDRSPFFWQYFFQPKPHRLHMILFSSVIPLKFGTLWATTEDTLEAKMLLIPRPKAMIFWETRRIAGLRFNWPDSPTAGSPAAFSGAWQAGFWAPEWGVELHWRLLGMNFKSCLWRGTLLTGTLVQRSV